MKTVIIGVPGSGKTTTAINILERLLNKYHPEDIVFCSFTNAAVDEAIERVTRKFGLEKKDFRYFGTIHSICYKFCPIREVIRLDDIFEFYSERKIPFKIEGFSEREDFSESETLGNIIHRIYNFFRNDMCVNVSDVDYQTFARWLAEKISVNPFKNMTPIEAFKIMRSFEDYKEEIMKIDFTDMLMIAYKEKAVPLARAMIVDEFQDLTNLQYRIIKMWEKEVEEVYYAGDDLQCIYSFMGGSYYFLVNEYNEADEKKILYKSWRLKRRVSEFANRFIKLNVRNTIPRMIESESDGGSVTRIKISEEMIPNLVLKLSTKGKGITILTRTNYLKDKIARLLLKSGIPFRNIGHGKQYFSERILKINSILNKLLNNEPLMGSEVKYLANLLPAKYCFIPKAKSKIISETVETEMYTKRDLYNMGFKMSYIGLKSYDDLVRPMNLSPEDKEILVKFRNLNNINIKISTIHSFKGKEDDIVILLTIPSRIWVSKMKSSKRIDLIESEARIWYVGMTRARDSLIICDIIGNSSIFEYFVF